MLISFLLGHASLATDRESRFVDQYIQAGQEMFAQLQQELNKLVMGGNSGVEDTKEVVMGDETQHKKQTLSLDSSGSDLTTAMIENLK